MGQVWYLIVLIPDLCLLTFFDELLLLFRNKLKTFNNTGGRMLDSIYHMKTNFEIAFCVKSHDFTLHLYGHDYITFNLSR